jgi:hypothetical protein
MEIIMRQRLVFAFFQVIVLCRSLAAILVLLTGMGSAMAQTQAIDTTNPANEVIVKSGHFMVRDHLVIDLQHGVEWMRCSVGQIWNGTDCEGVAMQLTQEDVAKAIVIANEQLGPGWRLPSRAELEGLVCKACAPVKIELDSFPNTLGEPYWTGEVNGFAPRHIWTVNFMTGHTYGRFFPTQEVLVRLVRDR